MKPRLHGFTRGVWETVYGNAAYISGPTAKTAWDLDMAEHIPWHQLTNKFLRKAEPGDAGRKRF